MAGRSVASPLMRDATGGHDHHLVSLQRKRDLMQHADDGFAAAHKRFGQQQPVGLMRRVEVGQRFVHQQHLGFNGQGTRQQHALTLPT